MRSFISRPYETLLFYPWPGELSFSCWLLQYGSNNTVCLICFPLLIVKVIFVITVFFLFLLCVSTILVNKDDPYDAHQTYRYPLVISRRRLYKTNANDLQKCLPVLLYSLEACPLTKTDLKSLYFVINRFL